jgi:cardiolipin synthase
MNIPNILTIIRLLLVPVFILVFFSEIPNAMLISFLIFLFAGLTDFLDGYIARKYNLVTKWGSVLDPLADKLMSITVLLCLTYEAIIPVWVLVVIMAKELLMIIGGAVLYKKGTYVPARFYGKVATVLFYVAVIFLEIHRTIDLILMYVTVFAALFSFYKYYENYKKYTQNKKLS